MCNCLFAVEDSTNLFENKDTAKVQGSVYWRQKLPLLNQTHNPPQPLAGGLRLGPATQAISQPLGQMALFGNLAFPANQQQQHVTYNGVPNVPLSEVVMGTLGVSTTVGLTTVAQFSALSQGPPLTQSPPVASSTSLFLVTVVLDSVYLLNYLLLKPYPEEPAAERSHLGFSYTVEISQDNSNWMMLFDYSSYTCYSTQSLVFPKQAIRYRTSYKLKQNSCM